MSAFIWVLRFPPPIQLTATISINIVESDVKHHNPKIPNGFTNSISSIVPDYLRLNNDQKLVYLMTCEDKNILRLASLFIFNCFKRKEISQLSSGGST
jgi:hypothetical protein